MYPRNTKMGQKIQTDVPGVVADQSFLAHIEIAAADAVVGDPDGVHAAVIDTGVQQVITTGITNPSIPRNITATFGGTATDIKAIEVIIEGTNYLDEVITETLPAATVDTAGIVIGNKAFKTVTEITIPAHDGVLATTAIGFGDKLGLPYLLERNTIKDVYLNDVEEVTAPTVVADSDEIEKNTIDLNSALDGTQVDIYLYV